MLPYLQNFFVVNLVIELWFNKTLCVSYFMKMRSGCFMILPVNKSDTTCLIIYCVHYGYIWSLKSVLSRHTMLAILLSCIGLLHDLTTKWIRHFVLAYLLSWLGVHLVIGQWFNQTLRVRYFTKMNSGCFMIWPVNKSDTICQRIYWVHLGHIWSLNIGLRHTLC